MTSLLWTPCTNSLWMHMWSCSRSVWPRATATRSLRSDSAISWSSTPTAPSSTQAGQPVVCWSSCLELTAPFSCSLEMCASQGRLCWHDTWQHLKYSSPALRSHRHSNARLFHSSGSSICAEQTNTWRAHSAPTAHKFCSSVRDDEALELIIASPTMSEGAEWIMIGCSTCCQQPCHLCC